MAEGTQTNMQQGDLMSLNNDWVGGYTDRHECILMLGKVISYAFSYFYKQGKYRTSGMLVCNWIDLAHGSFLDSEP